MENIESIGKEIKDRRLSLNLRMEDVARKAKITRSTLYSLEKGKGNISFRSLIGVLDVLGLSLSIKTQDTKEPNRNRASRRTTVLDKKINRFVIMCVEQYALYARKRSKDVYLELKRNGIIDELENDYEDLHGMSTTYLNDYIDSILGGNCS